jgi:ribonuclease P protein subunit POP4
MKATLDIVRHEFIGTEARISKSCNGENIGISGRIVDETRNTFVIFQQGKRKIIPKDSSVFQFGFPDKTIVEIDGKILLGRPEDRLKKTIRRLW